MRICILGNSHVACLKLAWGQLAAAHLDLDVKFFASPSSGLFSLELCDGLLKPSDPRVVRHIEITSGGMSAIRLDDFDVFFVHGLNFVAPTLPVHLSQAVVRQCVADAAERTFNLQLCSALVRNTCAHVCAGHTPMQARATSPGLMPYEKLSQAMQIVLAERSIRFVMQPLPTVQYPMGTKEEYARDSKPLEFAQREYHEEGEVMHMNADFGMQLLNNFLSMIGVSPTDISHKQGQ